MSFLILCLLCIVQGLTEFLPVSSSGHLTMFEKIFNIETDLLLLNLFLHLASLLAVVIYYRKTILKIIRNPFQQITLKLLISTLITIVFAIVYEIFNLNQYVFRFYNYFFLISAIILYLCYVYQKNSIVYKKENITYKDSILVGIAQGFAVFPGLTRSGTTIATLIFLKNKDSTAAEYSFLMSIPIILGGFVSKLFMVSDINILFENINLLQYILAFVLTFAIALVSLKYTVKMLKNQKFIYFSAYLIIIFIITLFI